MCYEVITAPTLEEALALSKWSEGDTAEVVDIVASAGCSSPVQWTLFPVFEKKENPSDE